MFAARWGGQWRRRTQRRGDRGPSTLRPQPGGEPLNLLQMIQVVAGKCFQLHPEGDDSAFRVKTIAVKVFS